METSINLSIFEVVKIVCALLIHETIIAIDVLDLLDVSCDWVIFTKIKPMEYSIGDLYGNTERNRVTNDNRSPAELQDL